LQIPSRVAAKENPVGKEDSIAPSGAYGFFVRFQRLTPWAIVFRHSVAGFIVHFQKLICAQQFLHQIFASQRHRMTEMNRRKILKIAVFAESGT